MVYFIKEVIDWKIIKWQEIKDFIGHLKDGRYTIEIKKQGDRTISQNKFYWQLLNIISEQVGIDPKELHYFFKNKFINNWDPFPSTTEMNKEEFSKYVNFIIDYACVNGIILPDYISN